MRRALERGEVKVFFQPVVRLEDRTIAGFEALLRGDHPRLGRLEPARVQPVAEQTGLVIDFGLLALERTARELAAWQRALAVDPPIFAWVASVRGNCCVTICCATSRACCCATMSSKAVSSSNWAKGW